MTMTSYYVRKTMDAGDPATSTWDIHSFVGNQPLKVGGSDTPASVVFNQQGAMTSTAKVAYDPFTPIGSAQTQSVSLDLTGSQQLATPFSVDERGQDGQTVGQLSGVSVGETGLITASFSNGDTQPLGKVALAHFTTPAGLRQLGASYWESTGVSGSAKIGTAGENGLGKLMSGTLEGSNVDITEELVNLIAAQRNFQANAKALDTATQISQSIFNIRA